MTQRYASEELAVFVRSVEDVPESTLEAAKRSVFDAVSCAVAGTSTKGAVAARKGALAIWGRGTIPIWLSSERSTAIGATFANSAATSMLDFDDGHRAAAGHPGAAIVPAVLAAVHENPDFEVRALHAIAIGYEVGIRIAAARDLPQLDTVNTGRWCGQAAAAAVGWLRDSPSRVIAEAISGVGAV
ncbi:MAG: MmgE/PrpD family protein, partial [Pseudomonadota bacterium]